MNGEWLAGLIIKDSQRWSMVWKAVQDLDIDRNGFLSIDELEACFMDQFPYELNGKSIALFCRQFSTDHDQNLVNYRRVKAEILGHRQSKLPIDRLSVAKSNLNELTQSISQKSLRKQTED